MSQEKQQDLTTLMFDFQDLMRNIRNELALNPDVAKKIAISSQLQAFSLLIDKAKYLNDLSCNIHKSQSRANGNYLNRE